MALGSLFARLRGPRTAPLPDRIDLSARAFEADLAPLFARLRAERPVAFCTDGGLLLTRHADILAALTDRTLGNAPSRFSPLAARNRDKTPAAALAANILPFQNAPDHVALRPLASRSFHLALAGLIDGLDDLADRHLARGHWPGDLIPVARGFALEVMRRFTGLPEGPDYKGVTQAFFHLFAPLADRAVFDALNAELGRHRAAIRQAIPAAPDGSLSAALRDSDVPPEIAADLVILFFADGVENIEAGIANVIAAMDEPATWLEALAAGAIGASALVDEGLRLRTPAQIITRVAMSDTLVAGQAVSAGRPVYLCLASAARDEAAVPDAGRFDPARDQSALPVFGRGRHSCIGAPMARAMIAALLNALARQGLRPTLPATELRFLPRFGHQWPVTYPMISAR